MSKAGPELGKLLSEVMDWQLAHPGGSLEQYKAHMLERHGQTAGSSA